MLKKAKPDIKRLTAIDFINIEEISDDILYSKDGYIFGYIYVRGNDAKLLSDEEKREHFKKVTGALETEKKAWQLISIPRTVNVAGIIENLVRLRDKTNHSAKLDLINGEIRAVQEMANEGKKEPIIILKCWEKAVKKADLLLRKRLLELSARLSNNDIRAEVLKTNEITYICKCFCDLTAYQDNDEDIYEDIPIIKNEKRLFSKRNDKSNINSLLTLLAPVGGIEFKMNKVLIGGVIGRVYGAIKYPRELDYGWAVDIMNSSESITSIAFNPANANQLAEALSGSINRNIIESTNTRDVRARKNLERQAQDADALLDEIDFNKEAIGHISVLTMPFTSDEDEFDEVCRRICLSFEGKRIKLKVLGNLQKDAYKALSPFYINQEEVDNITAHIMPLQTLIGGSPMTINIYRDDNGCYFAKTNDGGIITLDFLYRGRDRTNSNMVITGKAGTGKSTALKHIMETLYMTGVKILVIDPEREFKPLCKNLGGTWLDAGGGNAKINPLQIRPVPPDDEDETDPLYLENDNAMVLHLKTLDIFFSLYLPGLTDMQKALLKRTVIELYNKFNITWDTDITALKAEDFPVFLDLYKLLEEKAKKDKEYKELAVLFYDIANGGDSFLWNGHTNIRTDNDFICFDTNKMNNTSDEIKRTQYFNILTMCWEIMSENRDEPVLLVCDEAYLMIDPNIPQSLMFLRNVMKRCRKYEGLLAVVSHSIVDFLDEKIKMYGQTLLDIPTYKIFFGTDGKNLKETTGLFSLTEAEQNILQAGIKTEALCMIGSSRVHIRFDIPQYKLDLMGDAGGR